MMFVTKKGNQQIMNTPITVPKVFAAFVSFEILVMKKILSEPESVQSIGHMCMIVTHLDI